MKKIKEQRLKKGNKKIISRHFIAKVFLYAGILYTSIFLSTNLHAASTEMLDHWVSPLPRFSESGIDPEALAKFIGDGQLLQVGNDKNFKLWSHGEVKDFSNVHIAVTSLVIDASPDEIRSVVLDVLSMPEYMPQIAEPEIIEKNGNNFLAEFIQTYALPLIQLKAKFRWQYTIEKNGDISVLLHKGDIDSGVMRWEFQPLKNGKTLVTHSYWGDLKTAGLAFKLVLKAQPELEDTMVPLAAVMVLQQLKERINGEGDSKQVGKTLVNDELPDEPVLPLFTKNKIPVNLLSQLLAQGRLIYVHPDQWIKGDEKPSRVKFASVLKISPYPKDKVQPLLHDFNYLPDYFSSWVRGVKVNKLEDGTEYLCSFKVAFGPIGVKLQYNFIEKQISENVFAYKDNGTGDFVDVFGIWEFAGVKKDTQTLVVFTNAVQLGDDRFVLRQGKKVPQIDLLMPIHMGLTVMTKQEPWLKEVLE